MTSSDRTGVTYGYDAVGRKVLREETYREEWGPASKAWGLKKAPGEKAAPANEGKGGGSEKGKGFDAETAKGDGAEKAKGNILSHEYGRSGQPYAQYYRANGEVIARKQFGLHGLINPAQEPSMKLAGGLKYYHNDLRGSVVALRHCDWNDVTNDYERWLKYTQTTTYTWTDFRKNTPKTFEQYTLDYREKWSGEMPEEILQPPQLEFSPVDVTRLESGTYSGSVRAAELVVQLLTGTEDQDSVEEGSKIALEPRQDCRGPGYWDFRLFDPDTWRLCEDIDWSTPFPETVSIFGKELINQMVSLGMTDEIKYLNSIVALHEGEPPRTGTEALIATINQVIADIMIAEFLAPLIVSGSGQASRTTGVEPRGAGSGPHPGGGVNTH